MPISTVPPGHFQLLAAVTGGDSRAERDLQASVQQQLEDSGFNVVAHSGRWDSEQEMLRDVCTRGAAAVDRVLLIWFVRLALWDCAGRKEVYEYVPPPVADRVSHMTDRLIRYLRRAASPGQDSEA